MPFHIAFDRDKNLEFILFKTTAYREEMFCTTNKPMAIQDDIGTFLLMFLNTDFEILEECSSFIYCFCFHNFYREKYPDKVPKNYLHSIKVTPKELVTELKSMVKKYKDIFLYVKHTFLKNLNLPYNIDFLKGNDDDDEYDESFYEKKDVNMPYDLNEINSFMENISLDFDLFRFLLGDILIYGYNVPYGFYSESIFSILGLEFKEFIACKNHTIRKCQNCGKYFIPQNLKETKYCNEIYDEKTKKTCRQIGKELAYKKSLKKDKALDMYRRRYMSLASSVSHYGTDKAIERFEKYKTEGSIMKAKYQSKEITAKEFEKWVNSTKN